MDGLIALLPESGSMSFNDFVAAAQAAKQPAGMWLRAKHQGKLFTWIDENGDHRISRNPQPQEEGAVNA